ncbi:MAG: hypothetical protein M1324_03065 [Patescibacteria group bacterium]|nr:hypothetical protein [Patescibacteria group bacterium]
MASIFLSNGSGRTVEVYDPECLGQRPRRDISTNLGSASITTTDGRDATLDDLKEGDGVEICTGSGKQPGLFKLVSREGVKEAA